jgi:hypothetical protein
MRTQSKILGTLAAFGLLASACSGASEPPTAESTDQVAQALSSPPGWYQVATSAKAVPTVVGITPTGAQVAFENMPDGWLYNIHGGGLWTIGSHLNTGTTIPISNGQPWGMDGNATVVVGQALNSGGSPVPAYWLPTTHAWTLLPLPPKTTIIQSLEPAAVAANNTGTVLAGWAYIGQPGITTGADYGVVWTYASGQWSTTLLPLVRSSVPGGSNHNYPRGMSNDGNTVVGYYQSAQGTPVLWNRPTTTSSWTATVISDAGQSVAGQATGTSTTGTWVAGGYAAIGQGSVGGLFKYNRTTHAFTNLGNCVAGDSGDNAHAAYVSDDGNTVAGTVCPYMLGTCQACVWTSSHGMQTLNAYLQGKGISLGSIHPTEIDGISADGKVIAVDGTGGSGYVTGVFVTP